MTIFFIVPLFIYVIGDISLDRPLGDMLKIRVGSRNRWWVGKCAALSLFAFIYILILCLSTILISLIIYPWDTQWSDSDLINNLINSNAMLHYSPIQILLQAMLLLVWGCVGLGLFNMLISFVSGREIIGYIVLLCIIFISIAAYTIGLKSPYINFSLNPHIDINLHSFGNLKSKWPSFFESIIYWWVWIVFFIIFGLWVSGKRDLLTRMDQS
ncbi:hypothetical protein [Paenibacillus sp. MMO-58]|uniref:hypothetical protein n=1 Tax=Paenibacillus sp. MMO-58 TaxID=3081290 RepID=UPI0030165533